MMHKISSCESFTNDQLTIEAGDIPSTFHFLPDFE